MTARTKQPLNARLAEHGAAVTTAKQRVRELELTHGRVAADVARLRDATVDSFADGDEQRAAKASRERATLERDGLPEAVERLEGARRALQRAEVEAGAFAVEHLDGLVRERSEQAHAAARQVEEALDGLAKAYAAWTAVEQDVAGLYRLAGQPTQDVARFPAELAELVRHARRVGDVEVPAPLPVAMAGRF